MLATQSQTLSTLKTGNFGSLKPHRAFGCFWSMSDHTSTTPCKQHPYHFKLMCDENICKGLKFPSDCCIIGDVFFDWVSNVYIIYTPHKPNKHTSSAGQAGGGSCKRNKPKEYPNNNDRMGRPLRIGSVSVRHVNNSCNFDPRTRLGDKCKELLEERHNAPKRILSETTAI